MGTWFVTCLRLLQQVAQDGGTKLMFEALRNKLIAKQFLLCCHPPLRLFLKEQNGRLLAELAVGTDWYL